MAAQVDRTKSRAPVLTGPFDRQTFTNESTQFVGIIRHQVCITNLQILISSAVQTWRTDTYVMCYQLDLCSLQYCRDDDSFLSHLSGT